MKPLSNLFLSFPPDKITENSIKLITKNYIGEQEGTQFPYEFRFAQMTTPTVHKKPFEVAKRQRDRTSVFH